MKHTLNRFISISQSSKGEIINILVIIAIWFIMIILVNPIGDFPLNDDWAYGISVQSVVEKGDFQLSGWTSTNLFSQVFWGALFCLPFGFSFTALRFSTLTLGLLGVIATYGLLREAHSNQKISLLGALLVAINPIYFGLSNSFMSDIPFFGFFTLSLYLLVRGLRRNSCIEVILGIFIAYFALLTRQLGIVLLLAFGCAFLIRKEFNIQNFIKGFLPTVLGLGIQTCYESWLHFTGRTPALYGKQVHDFFAAFSKERFHLVTLFLERTSTALIYMGLFMFPFLIILFFINFKKMTSQQKTLSLFALSTFFVMIMGRLLLKHKIMPLEGNILLNFGLGPIGVAGGYTPSFQKAFKIFWWLLTAIGVAGNALLLQHLFFTIRQILFKNPKIVSYPEKWLNVLIISAISIYFFPLAIQGFYDRYLILLLPLLMMMVSVSTTNIDSWNVGNKVIPIALIMMLLTGVFTIGATHDYLSWNRVRWQALHNLMQESQISPHTIDGGFEFNGWYLYNPKYQYTSGKNWWWVDNDDYSISFRPLPGYEKVKEFACIRWLPFGPNKIFVLHKSPV